MNRALTVLILGVAASVSGCASYKPVPEGYSGPVASVADTGLSEDGTKSQIFALVEVDGHRIGNSFILTTQANQGRGFFLSPRYVERAVPAQPMKATLRGSHVTGAPIQAMALQLAGRFYSVEGTVDFTPKPDHRYVVKGELSGEGSSVWLEDAESGELASTKVTRK